jgi:hypothetical protein
LVSGCVTNAFRILTNAVSQNKIACGRPQAPWPREKGVNQRIPNGNRRPEALAKTLGGHSKQPNQPPGVFASVALLLNRATRLWGRATLLLTFLFFDQHVKYYCVTIVTNPLFPPNIVSRSKIMFEQTLFTHD